MRVEEIICELQPYIPCPPVAVQQLRKNATAQDDSTIKMWEKTWLANIVQNKKRFGTFAENGVGVLWNKFQNLPCVVAGSGPSLAKNGHLLANRGNIPLVSCLHNFHYFVEKGVPVDYWVTLDAGDITIEEVSEGGVFDEEAYWKATEGQTLLAFIGSSPRLLEKWRGRILFFTAPLPDLGLMKKIDDIEDFRTGLSTGGNVLGACTYVAKAIFGCYTLAFVGADFCFSYKHKFHGWDSKYDADLGAYIRTVDIYGNSVLTWASYYGFKQWFDWLSMAVSGIYINCTEGGTFGAYREGNIMSVIQMELAKFLDMTSLSRHVENQCKDPSKAERVLLF
jgi:hypothetical protein